MTLQFTRKQLITLLLLIVLLVGSFSLFYYIKIKPIHTTNEQLRIDLKMEKRLYDTVVDKQKYNDKPIKSSTEVQKIVPVIPLVEQLILDLQRAETTSNCKITNMTFGEGDKIQINSDASTVVKKNQQIIIEPEIAEALKQIIVTLTVESPSYHELEDFLATIEHQTRITKVNSLNFTGRPELYSVNQEPTSLNFDVTISSLYMPDLVDLVDDAPKIDIPDPSNKTDPLAIGLDKE
ncbi:pilus assembly protein PilO [Fredinandcohnia quinoae]|uniref:Pilus assembly protein PilO n=1 Tax=Fredinandcohnia quinoae TaxID=2918902 RepID=A0AAW5E0Y7_9BACI|nr:pilus assembly protein PilO [Fredinandcohnia sp. SECRCQ15]MCH1626580.1 pilus assembly protein PilO [Fredinandcohnia sp. SECRCQ15]